MKTVFKWLTLNFISSVLMSFFIVYIIIGAVKGFSNPSVNKVLFFFILTYPFSLIFGFPLLLLLMLKDHLKFQKKCSFLGIYIGVIILILIISANYFHFNLLEFLALFCSYVPSYFYLFLKINYS